MLSAIKKQHRKHKSKNKQEKQQKKQQEKQQEQNDYYRNSYYPNCYFEVTVCPKTKQFLFDGHKKLNLKKNKHYYFGISIELHHQYPLYIDTINHCNSTTITADKIIMSFKTESNSTDQIPYFCMSDEKNMKGIFKIKPLFTIL